MRTIRLHLTIPGEGPDAVAVTLAGLDPVELATAGSAVTVSESSWSCVDNGDSTAVTFAARVDFGAASRVAPSETAAAQALVDQALRMASILFDGRLRVDDVVVQGHCPPALSVA
jgi:hypothetical protein